MACRGDAGQRARRRLALLLIAAMYSSNLCEVSFVELDQAIVGLPDPME